jgi:hypothetical protein
MVLHAVIIEIGDFGTRDVGAIGAAGDIRFARGTGPHGAPAAKGSHAPASNTTVAQNIFQL